MSEFNSEYVKNLPDAYNKSSDSNNYKILSLFKKDISKLKKDIEDVYKSLDLEQAAGKTLDLYGDMLGQDRGFATDDQYRVMIKSKIMRNLMNGDYTSFMKATCMMFNCEPSEFYINEGEDPATVDIITLPFRVLNYIGLSAELTVELIKILIPVGIGLNSVDLSGTFEFCESESDMDYDEEKGFAISEADQSIGGYLGYLFQNDKDKPLPI